MKNKLFKTPLAALLSLMGLVAAQPAWAAHDLAARGNGFERFQWFCQPDMKPGQTISAAGDLASPFATRASAGGREWFWTGKQPFDSAIIQEARGLIEPSERAARSGRRVPHMRLEVDFQEGVTWRGIPISSYASHYAPVGSYSYFTTPLSVEQVRAAFKKDDPKSAAEFASFQRDEDRLSSSPEGRSLKAALAKLDGRAQKISLSASQAAGEGAPAWRSTRFNAGGSLLPGDKALPGQTKIGCFGRGSETGSADELPPVFEAR